MPPTDAFVTTVDHLVVACADLNQGAAWCQALFGVAPEPGGAHPLMGTHNRLLQIGSPAFPQAYLELIAIDPAAGPPLAGRARWFGLDDPALQRALVRSPRLVHWVAATPSIQRAHAAMRACGEDPGDPVPASRETPHGRLAWQITLRHDGRPQHGGALPALIEWQGVHPSARLPERGVRLCSMDLRSPQPEALSRAVDAVGLTAAVTRAGATAANPPGMALSVRLRGLRGDVPLFGGADLPASG